jgi:hypothetical protein
VDKKKVREYILHNYMPFVGHSITKAMKDGLIQDRHDLAHIQEEAVAGLMKAIQSYKPGRGSFASYAVGTIDGAVKSAVASQESRHYIPHDMARAKAEAKRSGEQGTQVVGSTAVDPSVRAARESAGGVASDEGAISGVGTETSPAARFASKYRSYVDSVIRPKVEAKEAEQKPTQQPAPAETPAAQEASKPKVVIRRERLSPERQDRIKHIDAAKMARGGQGGNQ